MRFSSFFYEQRCRLHGTAWQRLMVRASTKGLVERFTFHDLKAMGVSDFDGDKRHAAGHKTASAAAIYDRKIEHIKPTK